MNKNNDDNNIDDFSLPDSRDDAEGVGTSGHNDTDDSFIDEIMGGIKSTVNGDDVSQPEDTDMTADSGNSVDSDVAEDSEDSTDSTDSELDDILDSDGGVAEDSTDSEAFSNIDNDRDYDSLLDVPDSDPKDILDGYTAEDYSDATTWDTGENNTYHEQVSDTPTWNSDWETEDDFGGTNVATPYVSASEKDKEDLFDEDSGLLQYDPSYDDEDYSVDHNPEKDSEGKEIGIGPLIALVTVIVLLLSGISILAYQALQSDDKNQEQGQPTVTITDDKGAGQPSTTTVTETKTENNGSAISKRDARIKELKESLKTAENSAKKAQQEKRGLERENDALKNRSARTVTTTKTKTKPTTKTVTSKATATKTKTVTSKGNNPKTDTKRVTTTVTKERVVNPSSNTPDSSDTPDNPA